MTEISTAILNWDRDMPGFTGDLSMVSRGGKVAVTKTLRVRNPKTDATREFTLTRTERNRENELVAYHFTSTNRTARGTLTLTLFND